MFQIGLFFTVCTGVFPGFGLAAAVILYYTVDDPNVGKCVPPKRLRPGRPCPRGPLKAEKRMRFNFRAGRCVRPRGGEVKAGYGMKQKAAARGAGRRGGFTLVELVVTLVILAILAAITAGGLVAYLRLANFRQNEADAKTMYMAAQNALTHMETSGQAEDWLRRVYNSTEGTGGGVKDTYMPKGTVKEGQSVIALFLDKGEYSAASRSADGQLVVELLDQYTYDKSLFNAAICVEISVNGAAAKDITAGAVYSVFYASRSQKLSFTAGATQTDVTNIQDRSYAARRQTLVGYYSVDDIVNKVELSSIKLKLRTAQIINGEALTLNWSSNSRHSDTDVAYTIDFYKKSAAGTAGTKWFRVKVDLYEASKADGGGYNAAGSTLARLPVYTYNDRGVLSTEASYYWFPLAYANGRFTLTLDAMVSAQTLYATKIANKLPQSFYSITRFFTAADYAAPPLFYASITAAPNENLSGAMNEEYTPSDPRLAYSDNGNPANALFTDDSAPDAATATTYKANVKLFRHLYNLRFLDTATTKTAASIQAASMDWLSGAVVVYQIPDSHNSKDALDPKNQPAASTPTRAAPVAWPTQAVFAKNQTLNGQVIAAATGTTPKNAVIANLQLRTDSVAKDSDTAGKEYHAQYVGLFGENRGTVKNLTLQNVDAVVNLTQSKVPDEVTAAVTAAQKGGLAPENTTANTLRQLRGVGALCGLNTGTLDTINLTTDTAKGQASRVAAAVSVPAAGQKYTGQDAATLGTGGNSKIADTVGDLRGIGGVAGISRTAVSYTTVSGTVSEDSDAYKMVSVTTDAVVTGLLLEPYATGTAPAQDGTKADQTRYAAAATTAAAKGLYLPVGIGGVAGYAQYGGDTTNNAVYLSKLYNLATTANKTANNPAVYGNMYTGGLFGCVTATAGQQTYDTGGTEASLFNGAIVRGSAVYPAAAAGATQAGAVSAYAGQFFGGIAGYARDITLWKAASAPGAAKDITVTALTSDALKNACTGDFVGGIFGFANGATLNSNGSLSSTITPSGGSPVNINKIGLVTGRRFVGGMIGGAANNSTATGINAQWATLTNKNLVFGNRYVGGILGVNGSGGLVQNFTNAGVIGGVPLGSENDGKGEYTPLCIGGIVGRNDGSWGAGTTAADAKIANCASKVYDNNGTISAALARLNADKADFVGGMAGYNDHGGFWYQGGENSVVLWGRNFVGGILGYAGPDTAADTGTNLQNTVRGQIYGSGSAVGGVVGLACTRELFVTGAKVSVNLVSGRYCVGGLVGAYIGEQADNSDPAPNGNLNALGVVRAQAVCGGLYGYTRQISNMADVRTRLENDEKDAAQATDSTILLKLLPVLQRDTNTNVLQPAQLPGATSGTSSASALTIQYNNVMAVRGSCYVGGIVGYNDENTYLKIHDSTNSGAITVYNDPAYQDNLTAGVLVDSYLTQNGFDKDYLGDATLRSHLFGGVIGVSSQHTLVTGCKNTGVIGGTVSNGTVNGTGGMAGLNEGTIERCTLGVNIGNAQQSYVGGMAGINACKADNTAAYDASHMQGVISAPQSDSGITVSGNSYVGGAAGINLTGALVTQNQEGDTCKANVQGSADNIGGLVGENRGKIEASAFGNSGAAAVRGAQNVGGIVGYNKSTVSGSMTVTARVTGGTAVGGIAGRNSGNLKGTNDNNQMKSAAAVTATGNYAGGIVGYNEAGLVQYAFADGKAEITAQGWDAGGVAGRNAQGATLQNSGSNSTITAANGHAAGIAAVNEGTVDACGNNGNNGKYFVQSLTANANAETIGAAVAVNTGTVQNCNLGTGVVLGGSRSNMTVGGLVGTNQGAVKDCSVPNWLASTPDSIAALGGAVGVNDTGGTVQTVDVNTSFGGDYQTVGGVAGSNLGTLTRCSYKGTLSGNAPGNGYCMGGIAGSNGNSSGAVAVITECEVKTITITAKGIFNVNATLDADSKLNLSSHIGGIVGRNFRAATLTACTMATEGKSDVQAAYGFVGGIAGSNDGTVTGCGGKDTNGLVNAITGTGGWLTQGNNAGRNAMVAELTIGTTYASLKGVDIAPAAKGDAWSDASQNQLQLTLTGNGYLAGVTAFNALHGSVTNSASGKWFIYGNGISGDGVVGGVIGQNESEQNLSGLVNCAAVRRYTSRVTGDTDYNAPVNDTGINMLYYVGGVIGEQQNRTTTGWFITNCVNYGTVFNSRTNYMGGIIARWRANGGTLDNCFNFGSLTTNANTTLGNSGCAGGIVGIVNEPTNGVAVNILNAQNYGAILGGGAFASNPSDNNIKAYSPNDCAGILGEVNTQSGADRLVINLVNCANGSTAAVYGRSLACGIFAWLGGGNTAKTQLNIDRCRNLCTDLYTNNGGGYYTRQSGIYGTRDKSTKDVAVTTLTNCFSLYDQSVGNTNMSSPLVFAEAQHDTTNKIQNGSNNYYMDQVSFNNYKTMQTMQRSVSAAAVYNDKDVSATFPTNTPITNWFDNSDKTIGTYVGDTTNATMTVTLTLPQAMALQEISLVRGTEYGNNNKANAFKIRVKAANSTDWQQLTIQNATSWQGTKSLSIYNSNVANAKIEQIEIALTGTRIGTKNPYRFSLATVELTSSTGQVINVLPTNTPANVKETDLTNDVGGHRLYAGVDLSASAADRSNNYPYFGALLDTSLKNDPSSINSIWGKIQATDYTDPAVERAIVGQNANTMATLPLLFSDSDKTTGLSLHDVTDEDIQRYYQYVLDAEAPGNLSNLTVQSSSSQTDNVYGRYLVQWDSPANSNAMRYHVEVFATDAQGTILSQTPLSSQDVYETSATFNAQPDWQADYFKVSVTAYNANNLASATLTSDNKMFARALPKPDLRLYTVKNGAAYSYMIELTNADAYDNATTGPGADKWKVTASVLSNANGTVTFTSSQTTLPFSLASNVTTSLRAQADPVGTTDWYRSEQFAKQVYIPKDCYPGGSLAIFSVTPAGTDIDNFKVNVSIGYTSGTVAPLYRVALMAKYNKSSANIGTDMDWAIGQYFTLRYQDIALPNGEKTAIDFSDLPTEFLSCFTDWQVCAWPVSSGLGPVYTWTQTGITENTFKQAISSVAGVDLRTRGYEIVASRDGSRTYTYQMATPLMDIASKARSERVKSLPLSITALPAPTLPATIDAPVIDANNQMTYTFTWDADITETRQYKITLTGIQSNADGTTTEVPIDVAGYTDPKAQTFTVNADDWNYNSVRLKVTRIGIGTQIGDAAQQTYPVVKRLPRITQPSVSLAEGNNDMDLLYQARWVGLDTTNQDYAKALDHYELYADIADIEGGATAVLLGKADAKDTSLKADLENYQGKKLSFYVIAAAKDGSGYKSSPIGLKETLTVPKRAAVPGINAVSITGDINGGYVAPLVFTDGLTVNIQLNNSTLIEGNYLMRAYFFATEADATAAIPSPSTSASSKGSYAGDGDSGVVMQVASAADKQLSLNLTGLAPENVIRYMVVQLRAAPTGAIASNWVTVVKANIVRLPGIKLATPALSIGTQTLNLTADLYDNPSHTGQAMQTHTFASSTLRTFVWPSVAYANQYAFTLTDLPATTGATQNTARITAKIGDDGSTVTVFKTMTVNGKEQEVALSPSADGGYDLSMVPAGPSSASLPTPGAAEEPPAQAAPAVEPAAPATPETATPETAAPEAATPETALAAAQPEAAADTTGTAEPATAETAVAYGDATTGSTVSSPRYLEGTYTDDAEVTYYYRIARAPLLYADKDTAGMVTGFHVILPDPDAKISEQDPGTLQTFTNQAALTADNPTTITEGTTVTRYYQTSEAATYILNQTS